MAYQHTIKFLKFQEQRHPEEFKLVKIPKKFYDDCIDCDVQGVLGETKTHYWINVLENKKQLNELIDRAYFYSDFKEWEPQYHGLVRSARATLKALEGAA
jgi:hypothetical protein